MLNDESFEKHVSQGDHEGNLKAADEDGFESDEEFVAVLGRVVDNPVPREEKAEDEAKKGDKDERTKKPDEAKSGKDVEWSSSRFSSSWSRKEALKQERGGDD